MSLSRSGGGGVGEGLRLYNMGGVKRMWVGLPVFYDLCKPSKCGPG